MAPSKAHLYLASFVREGMAFQDPETGHYGLGPFAASLGLSAIRQLSIVDEARSYLRQLSERTGCAAYLSILGETGPAIVSKADGTRQGVLSVQLGYVLPLTYSATGQIFLAYLPPARRAALLDREYAGLARNPDSYVPRDKLEAALAKVLKQGFATTSGQLNANFIAAAAPVFDYNGDIAAALTVLGPDKYLSSSKLKESVADLLEMAAGLSRAIGAPDPNEPARLKSHRDRLDLRVGLDAGAAILAPPAGLLEPAERQRGIESATVDSHRSGLELAHQVMRGREIVGPHHGAEAIVAGIGQRGDRPPDRFPRSASRTARGRISLPGPRAWTRWCWSGRSAARNSREHRQRSAW